MLTLLIQTSGGANGNASAFNSIIIPSGQHAVLMLSSGYLIRLICPKVADNLGIERNNLSKPSRLSSAVDIEVNKRDVKLESFSVKVIKDYIQAKGKITDSGFGWDAEVGFEVRLFPELKNGELHFRTKELEPKVDIDIEWWVWLTSFAIGGIIQGIIGSIVAVIVVAITEGIADAILTSKTEDSFDLEIEDNPIPFGPIGTDLNVQSIVLDDFLFSGSVIRSIEMPIKRSDILVFDGYRSIDLDTGASLHTAQPELYNYVYGSPVLVRPAVPLGQPGYDIGFVAGEIKPLNAASIATMYGAVFEQVSPSDLENVQMQMSNSAAIPYSEIPVGFVTGSPAIPEDYIILAIRTNTGRFSKCAVSQNPSGSIQIRYVTYEKPLPAVNVIFVNIVDANGQLLELIYKAEPRLMAYPMTFEWRIGTKKLQGNGSVTIGQHYFEFTVDGKICKLKLKSEAFGKHHYLSVTCTDSIGMIKTGSIEIGVVELKKPEYDLELFSRFMEIGDWIAEKIPGIPRSEADMGLGGRKPHPEPLPQLIKSLKLSEITPNALVCDGTLGNFIGLIDSPNGPNISKNWDMEFRAAIERGMK